MRRRATRSSSWALRALAIAAPMLACSGRDLRHSDSALPAVPPAAKSPAADVPTAILPPAVPLSCAVTDSSIGAIRLGMTFAEAKQALPAAQFELDSDAEGAVLVGVTLGGEVLMALFANDLEEGTMDWTRRIDFMETFNPSCSTTNGVHPESLILDVEKVLGKTTTIMLSEIESREFITFERQPAGMIFRIDYTGIFDEGSRETQRFERGAKIFSIALSAQRMQDTTALRSSR